MSATGIGKSWLAARLGIDAATLTRMCDPDHEKPLTLERLLQVRIVAPRLYLELVHRLSELEAGSGEEKPESDHLRALVRIMGSVAAAVQTADLERALCDLEHAARQARRDLRRTA